MIILVKVDITGGYNRIVKKVLFEISIIATLVSIIIIILACKK